MKYLHDTLLDKIKLDLINKYKCHTIILYGSRARNEATPTSDYDIIGVCENGEFMRDCRLIENHYLDAFIYPEEAVINPDPSLIRIKDGVILCQKNNTGDALLQKVQNMFKSGPPTTPDWEKQEINTWISKMLNRAKHEDIEGNFRRHWLLHDLLECYFKLRNSWYLGPKESFQWLKNNDSKTYDAFESALKTNASLDTIDNLISHVKK